MSNEEDKVKLKLKQLEKEERSDLLKGLIAFLILAPVAALVVYIVQNWEDVSELLFWVLIAFAAIGILAGVAWFLVVYGVIINPFSVESRADKLEVRKERHISKITRGRPEHELTESELRRKDRIEAAYNARIARLMDKL